ncbi:MAG: ABC transporter substrate-binding protein [Kangiellaceae bacterium]|nr:ABC transporter substrate-binding protein [Kangiellaceae bacterium]MCW9016379.1 ABC transporter substrate-binding protein [Kangiellaceae bacterium]
MSLLLLLIACTEPVPTQKIGILYKAGYPPGESLVRAAKLVERQLKSERVKTKNAAYRIQFVFQDVGLTQETALAALYSLVKKHQIKALVGPTSSQLAIPIAEVANNMRIPMISPTSTHPATTLNKPYIFRGAFLDEAQAIALSKFVGIEIKPNRIAALFDVTNSYSKGLVEDFKRHYEANYQKTVKLMTYLPGETSFKSHFAELEAQKVELLLLPNFTSDAELQINQLIEANWSVTLLGSDSWWPAKLKLKRLENKMYYSHHWDNIFFENNQASKTFSAEYFDLFRQQPSIVAALSFDAINLLIHAMALSNQNQENDIRSSLVSIKNYNGVTGGFSFNQSGDPEKAIYIFEIKNQKIILKSEIINVRQ